MYYFENDVYFCALHKAVDYIVIDNRFIAKGLQKSIFCMHVKKLQPYIIVCIMIKNSDELIALAQPLWRFNVYIYS